MAAFDLKQFQDLQDTVNRSQRELDRATGALDQLKQQVRREFGINWEDADAALLKLVEQKEELTEQYETELQTLLEKWPHVLDSPKRSGRYQTK